MEKTEGHPQSEQKKVVLSHVLSWAIMIVMTIVAFVAVGMQLMPPGPLIAFIVVLAVVQAFLQVYIFMHMKHEKVYPALFMFWGAILGFVCALGIWWMV